MARFNTRKRAATSPVAASPVATTGGTVTNHEGGHGHLRDAKSELFLLAVEDAQWTAGLLGWLRDEGHMRTASIVGAAEYVKARLDAGVSEGPSNRSVIASVLQRPDEPGELLAYWTASYGRALPKPVKRGVADAVQRLYHGKSLLKYDTASKGFRFGDVLNLVHAAPDPAKPWQGDLFQYAVDRRHHPENAVAPKSVPVLTAHRDLMALRPAKRRALLRKANAAERLAGAGMTWGASRAGSRRVPLVRVVPPTEVGLTQQPLRVVHEVARCDE